MHVLYSEAAKADLKIGVTLADDVEVVYNETAAEGSPHALSLFNAFCALAMRVIQEYGMSTALYGLGKMSEAIEKREDLRKALENKGRNGIIALPPRKKA